MILPLPDYDYMFDNDIGEIKGQILYIYRVGSFDEIMRKLTYLVYGKHECFFCHKKFVEKKDENDNTCFLTSQTTLDHLIPQEFGGPTIPNNLRPACSFCNLSKGNYYPEEYAQFKLLSNAPPKNMKEFVESVKIIQSKRKKGEIDTFPKEWCTQENPRKYFLVSALTDHRGSGYRKQKGFYEQYKRLPKPIIVSANGFVLKGYSTIALALEYDISKVDTITLENTICKELQILP